MTPSLTHQKDSKGRPTHVYYDVLSPYPWTISLHKSVKVQDAKWLISHNYIPNPFFLKVGYNILQDCYDSTGLKLISVLQKLDSYTEKQPYK